MEEEKDKQYYMDLCYRLRSKLKNSEGKKFEQEVYTLRRKLKTYDEQKEKEIAKLKNKLEKYKIISQSGKNISQTIDKLKDKNKSLKLELNKSKDKINMLESKLKSQDLETKNKLYSYQDMIDLAIKKNKRVIGKDIYELAEHEDKARITLKTIMFDLENAFIFQKLFEMHIYDYIVDRQNPDNKTEEDTKNLIFICKQFTNNILRNQIYKTSLDIGMFKEIFKHFVSNYVELYFKE